MKTWTDPNAPGWTLNLDETTGEWTLALSATSRSIPTGWVVSSRHSPTVVWLGSVPVYMWSEGHDAHLATLSTPVVFRGVFGGVATYESTPEVRRCECGAEKTYGRGCSWVLHARWCQMFVLTRSEGRGGTP